MNAQSFNIKGLNPGIAENLTFLSTLRTTRMPLDERAELLHGSLMNLANEVCNTVTDWSQLRLPLSSWQAWLAAKELTQGQCSEISEQIWQLACQELETLLKAGYYMAADDLA